MWAYFTVVILNEITYYVYFLYFLLPNMFYTVHNSVFFKSFEFEFLSNLYCYMFFYLQPRLVNILLFYSRYRGFPSYITTKRNTIVYFR